MTHLEQHHFGQPSRNGYHNKQWAELMKSVGLFPSDTAQPGGKETGQRGGEIEGGKGSRQLARSERGGQCGDVHADTATRGDHSRRGHAAHQF